MKVQNKWHMLDLGNVSKILMTPKCQRSFSITLTVNQWIYKPRILWLHSALYVKQPFKCGRKKIKLTDIMQFTEIGAMFHMLCTDAISPGI